MIVSQLTARRDYSIAKIMHSDNRLEMLFTDAYYNSSELKIFKIIDKIVPTSIVQTYKRYNPNIPVDKVNFNWKIALYFRFLMRKDNVDDKFKAQIWAYRKLSQSVIKYCKKNKKIDSYYGFDTACLEFFEWAEDKNFKLYIDQSVAPRRTQINLIKRIENNYGIKDPDAERYCSEMMEREKREWELATKIFAPSDFVRNELIAAGAPSFKICLVPFGYDSPVELDVRERNLSKKTNFKQNGKTKILFAGNAGLRKGVLDILEVSKHFEKYDVEFILAGQIDKELEIKLNIQPNIKTLGKLPLPELLEQYKKSDIFFFPSYLEGSARVVFEAMSWGLPVITTHETGSVIQNGNEGFLVDAGDVNSMKWGLHKLIESPDLRLKMGIKGIEAVENFSIANYKKNLLKEINQDG